MKSGSRFHAGMFAAIVVASGAVRCASPNPPGTHGGDSATSRSDTAADTSHALDVTDASTGRPDAVDTIDQDVGSDTRSASTCEAADYFVSSDGSDTNAGDSPGQAWLTLQKAADSGSGVVCVTAGTYSGRVRLTRSNLQFLTQGEVVSTGGFNITGNGNTIHGFHVLNASDTGGGIVVSGTGNVIRGNRIEQATLVGIEVEGTNQRIEANEVSRTVQDTTSDADGMRFFGSGHVFIGNYIHDIHYGSRVTTAHIDCFQTWGDSGRGGAGNNTIFERNVCINTDYVSTSASSQGFMMENGAHDILIRNNIIQSHRSINLGDPDDTAITTRITVVNNTMIGTIPPHAGEQEYGVFITMATDVTTQNNIFYNIIGLTLYGTMTTGNNLFYRGDGRPLSGTRGSTDVWGVDPQFVSPTTGDYHLRSTSPAINAGSNTGVVDDKDGTPRPQGSAYDIGAYEYL